MTTVIKDLVHTEELSPEQREEIHGGWFFGGCVAPLPLEEPAIISCHNGVCGTYPIGTRTDEAR
jgi:hypothetical protein